MKKTRQAIIAGATAIALSTVGVGANAAENPAANTATVDTATISTAEPETSPVPEPQDQGSSSDVAKGEGSSLDDVNWDTVNNVIDVIGKIVKIVSGIFV